MGEGTPIGKPLRVARIAAAALIVTGALLAGGRLDAVSPPVNKPVAAERRISSFSLRDAGGVAFTSDDVKDRKFLVVVFLGTECPLAKLYASRLQHVADDYRERGVAVIGIDSNAQDSNADLTAYVRLHQIKFPLLKDPGATVADLFQARRTPEAFILDREQVVRYRGRIDDQYGIGVVRPEPKHHDLRQALDELLKDGKVSRPMTEPVGCLIGRPTTPKENAAVTYSKQISRLLNQHCVDCHRPGEIGPFSLTDYDEVVGWAATIAEVVETNRMPPWHADPKFGKFDGDRSLSAAEKQLIVDWVAAGAPRGDVADMPEATQYLASGWQLPREPDFVVPMSATPQKVPAEGIVDYLYFVVDPGFTEDKWFTAAELKPGNRAVVHHVLVFTASKEWLESNAGESLEGYAAAYVPGMRAASYPAGMAKRIPAGTKLIFQVHYSPNGSEQFDCTRLGLLFADPATVTHEVLSGFALNRALAIPPRNAHYIATALSAPSPAESILLSMMPHMHARGSTFRYELVSPKGKIETLLDVPHYDWNWQTTYRLLEPRTLPPNCRIRCTALYDNSDDNPGNPDSSKLVRWGQHVSDEMLVGYFDIAVPRK